jgi:hypothetical protein
MNIIMTMRYLLSNLFQFLGNVRARWCNDFAIESARYPDEAGPGGTIAFQEYRPTGAPNRNRIYRVIAGHEFPGFEHCVAMIGPGKAASAR